MAGNVNLAGTEAAQNSMAASTVAGTGTLASVPDVASLNKTLAQPLAELMAALETLLETPMTAENLAERNTEVTKLREQMAKVQEDINAENTRMAEVQTYIHDEAERLRAEALHLNFHQNASDMVHEGRHQSRLPSNDEPTRLFRHRRMRLS